MIELFKKYGNLISELVTRDIKKKYRRSILGVLWSVLNPLLMMIITAMVFSQIFKFQVENYILYLLSGQVLFTFFSESTNFAMSSVISNGSLIKKIYIPKFIFPISRVLSSGVNLCFMLPALIVIMIYSGSHFSFWQLTAVVPLILLLVFCMGMGFLLASVAVFFRDSFHLYAVILRALMYATPIFYPASIVPEKYHLVIDLNPLFYYLDAFRTVVLEAQAPSLSQIGICSIISFMTLAIGYLVFSRTQNRFVLYI